MGVTYAVKKEKKKKEKADLPGWKELSGRNKRKAASSMAAGFIDRVSTVRFTLLVVLLTGGLTLYVSHVQATQELLNEVQRARIENRQLHLKLSRLKGAFDRRTGPTLIRRRAKELGLKTGISYGPSISVEE